MFDFKIADFVPYKNKEVLDRVRKMSGEELTKHPNPDFKIQIVPDTNAIVVANMIARIQRSDLFNEKCVMILGNPNPTRYQSVAKAINMLKINCRNLVVYTMDEWADEDGNVAPIDYKAGFTYSQLKYFYGQIDEDLRMPLENIHYPTTKNIKDYSQMLHDEGDADICYSGPGWAGHIAFIDPCTPEFSSDLDEFLNQGARIVTLNPLTIMQNSLHGVFGQSGDIANVPPRAATIGPLDVKRAKARIESHALATGGSFSSWQRMISRLIIQGEVTPLVPASILQLMKTNVFLSESIAKPIDCMEKVGY